VGAIRRWVAAAVVAGGCAHARSDPAPREATTRPPLLAYVQSVTRCVTEASGLAATIEITDSADVNAWARPGHRVELTRGLLAHLRSEAELQAVVAHELGHLASGHVPPTEPEASPAVSEVGLFAGLVGAAREAAHSRAHERDADDAAVRYLRTCGRSAHAMLELFDVLERHEGDDDTLAWFASHPSFEQRRERMRRQIDAAPRRDPGRTRYVEALTGLVYGEDPRHGFVRGREYVVPAMDARLSVPRAWSGRVEDGMLLSQAPDERSFLVVARAPGPGLPRVKAAIDAGGFAGGEIDEYDVGDVRVTVAGFGLGDFGGIIVHFERDPAGLVLFGLAPRHDWDAFATEVKNVMESFGRIEDRRLLAVQPLRLDSVRLEHPATLAEVMRSHPSAIGLDELARLNGIDADATLPAGTVLKRVAGSSPPEVPHAGGPCLPGSSPASTTAISKRSPDRATLSRPRRLQRGAGNLASSRSTA
jgi:predicted Zn-dependent protease